MPSKERSPEQIIASNSKSLLTKLRIPSGIIQKVITLGRVSNIQSLMEASPDDTATIAFSCMNTYFYNKRGKGIEFYHERLSTPDGHTYSDITYRVAESSGKEQLAIKTSTKNGIQVMESCMLVNNDPVSGAVFERAGEKSPFVLKQSSWGEGDPYPLKPLTPEDNVEMIHYIF